MSTNASNNTAGGAVHAPDLRDAVATLFGVDVSVIPLASGWREGEAWAATAKGRVAGCDLVVDLFPAGETGRDAWFRSPRFSFAYRASSGADAFQEPAVAAWLEQVRQRIAALDGREPAPQVVSFFTALSAGAVPSAVSQPGPSEPEKPEPQDAGLTPFTGELARGLRDALLAAMGVEPSQLSAFQAQPAPGGWLAALTLRVAGRDLCIEACPQGVARDVWFRAGTLGFGYRALDGVDAFASPALAEWLRAFRNRCSSAAPQAMNAVADAAARWLPFGSLPDGEFACVFDTQAGPTALLHLGFRCNQDCHICPQGRAWPEPPPEMFARWLDELASKGVRQVIISGGEPTLRDDLPALIARAVAAGMQPVLETNGTRLAEQPLRETLRAAGLRALTVSLHSHDPAVSDRITRAPGSHARTVEGVRAALADGYDVGLHCVVERANLSSLDAYAARVVDLFVTPFPQSPLRRVAFSAPQQYYSADAWREGRVAPGAMGMALERAATTLRAAGLLVTHPGGR